MDPERRLSVNDGSEPVVGLLGMVVAAGGYGSRLGHERPKQYAEICGVPMLRRTLTVLSVCPHVAYIVVVVNPEDVQYCEREVVPPDGGKVRAVVGGGAERALSVREGLRALYREGIPDLLGVHDGARPFVRCEDIGRAVQRLDNDGSLDGVVLGIPVTDTIKVVDEDGCIRNRKTPERRYVWRAQTPQIFRGPILRAAYAQEEEVVRRATDDAGLVETLGGRLAVVEGSVRNFKVTSPEDLRLAEILACEEEGA